MHRGILSALPLPPTNLAASEVTSDSVTLTWSSGNTEPVQSYIIQYKVKHLSDDYSSIAGVITTQYTVSLLKANTAYQFKVVAVNEAGQSQPSLLLHVSTSEGRLVRLAECNISTLNISCQNIVNIITVGKSNDFCQKQCKIRDYWECLFLHSCSSNFQAIISISHLSTLRISRLIFIPTFTLTGYFHQAARRQWGTP